MLAYDTGYQGSHVSSNIPQGLHDTVSPQHLSKQRTLEFLHGPQNVLLNPSNLAPWSQMNLTEKFLTDGSTSGELLFGLDDAIPCLGDQGHTLRSSNQLSISEDGIGDPPDSNPIGPPPSFNTDQEVPSQEALGNGSPPHVNRRRGRRGRLDSQTREHAARVRKSGACWSCMILKQKAIAPKMTAREVS